MSKILLIERCEKCPCYITGRTYDWSRRGVACLFDGVEPLDDGFPDDCPLCPLPDKRPEEKNDWGHLTQKENAAMNHGWNKCLDAITGGKET